MNSAEAMEPIFVLGRQHSGNTMLTTLLGRIPSVLGISGEGKFFERRRELDGMPPAERAKRTARCIRDEGVRDLLRSAEVEPDMSIWEEITPRMESASARGASATELYGLGMQEVLQRTGTARWAQKATSYIFLVDEILETFPCARLVFLVRNPLDLAASTARRNGTFRHTVRMALGWNRGVKRALYLQAAYPQSVMLLRYEDLVRDSERSVRQVCAFCGLPFDETCLDVPHVNKSDSPYNEEGKDRGLSASRVFYYREMLSSAERTATRLAIEGEVLARLYPELAEQADRRTPKDLGQAIGLLTASALQLFVEEGRQLAEAPWTRGRRILRRLGGKR